jgi:hypothetical protein
LVKVKCEKVSTSWVVFVYFRDCVETLYKLKRFQVVSPFRVFFIKRVFSLNNIICNWKNKWTNTIITRLWRYISVIHFQNIAPESSCLRAMKLQPWIKRGRCYHGVNRFLLHVIFYTYFMQPIRIEESNDSHTYIW